MGGFLNQDNLPHLVQKLTDGNNIKITGNKHGDRVGKVVNKLIDKSNETLGASFKELKNEEYSFKTGEGSGVDLSNSTLDSFTTFALEGNTYKNLVKNGTEELVLNPEIKKEGTGFELDGTFDGGSLEFEVKGQTLKNIAPNPVNFEGWSNRRGAVTRGGGYLKIQANETTQAYGNGLSEIEVKGGLYQQGKTYTLILDYRTGGSNVYDILMSRWSTETAVIGKYPATSEWKTIKTAFTPQDSNLSYLCFYIRHKGDKNNYDYWGEIRNLRILEGNWVEKEPPAFFEGAQGVGRKSKNLLNENILEYGTVTNNGSLGSSTTIIRPNCFIEVKENTTYTISIDRMYLNGNMTGLLPFYFIEYNANKEPLRGSSSYNGGNFKDYRNDIQVTTNKGTKFVKFRLEFLKEGLDLKKSKMQIEEGDRATPYEPYLEGYKIGVKTHGKNLAITSTQTNKDANPYNYIKFIQPKSDTSILSFKSEEITPDTKGNGIMRITLKDKPSSPINVYAGEFKKGKGKVQINGVIDEIFLTTWSDGVYNLSDIQLEEGTQATSYEPYKESASEIILQDQLHGMDGLKDRLYFDEGYKIEKKINTIDVSELADNMFNYTPGTDENFSTMGVELPNFAPENKWSSTNIVCDKLKVNDNPVRMQEGICAYSNGYLYITIKNENLKGKNVASWVKENKPKIWYKAKTPTIVDIAIKAEMPLTTFNTKTYIAQDSGLKGNLKISNKGYKTYNLLPNKEYTVIVDKQENSSVALDLCGVKKVIDGDRGTISTSTNNLGELKFYGNGKAKNIRLLEGNAVNKAVGYFEGVQGVGEKGVIKARACGKNLFCVNDEILKNGSIGYFNGKKCLRIRDNSGKPVIFKNKSSKPGLLTLTIHFYRPKGLEGKLVPVCFVYKNGEKHIYHNRPINETITLTSRENSVLDNIYIGWNFSEELFIDLEKTQVELGESTPYEPYEESDFSIELEEPLMRLPNGVCDEITKDGKLIRRVGKVVWDGSQDCSIHNKGERYTRFRIAIPNIAIANTDAVLPNIIGFCDKMTLSDVVLGSAIESYMECAHSPSATHHGGCGYLSLSRDKAQTTEQCKDYFREHPITLWYQLRQPVVTDIKPLQARLFKNGHIIFDNKIAPVSTYEVAVNKPAQINAGIKETQKLENRVNALEGLYDSMLLENSHILSNLEFDFSLMKEVEE